MISEITRQAVTLMVGLAISVKAQPPQHTPGPWLLDKRLGSQGDLFTIYQDTTRRVIVAKIPRTRLHKADPKAADANAALIASAPDLDLYQRYVGRVLAQVEPRAWLPVSYTEYAASELIEHDRAVMKEIKNGT